MNCKYHFFLHFFFLPLWIISQCNQTIKYENSIYVGCLNFEGVPHGEGRLDLNFDDQIQTQDGNFKDGEFFSGELLVDFLDGEKRIINYLNYPQELISDELYIWKNLDKKLTIYQNGYKSKEVKTYGPGDRSGLVETTYYEKGKNPIIIRNTDNNRNPDDIIGDKEYTDVTLIEKNNQYRINIVFPTKNGEEIQVPIQFDSGATSFFIGHNLYKELKKSADIIDLNVKGNPLDEQKKWKEIVIDGKKLVRETDTLDTFVCSSWYLYNCRQARLTLGRLDIRQARQAMRSTMQHSECEEEYKMGPLLCPPRPADAP